MSLKTNCGGSSGKQVLERTGICLVGQLQESCIPSTGTNPAYREGDSVV